MITVIYYKVLAIEHLHLYIFLYCFTFALNNFAWNFYCKKSNDNIFNTIVIKAVVSVYSDGKSGYGCYGFYILNMLNNY